MSSETDTLNTEARRASPAARPTWLTFAWSLRRELWEHRMVFIAPLAVAAFVVFAHFISTLAIPDGVRAATLADPTKAHEFMSVYGGAAFAVLLTGLVTGALYCLDALQGERRDRSILFWKSLPVSDLTAVLSKMAVPTVVLPLTVLVLIVVSNLAMLILQSVEWRLDGFDPRQLWARLNLPYLWLTMLYGLPFMALWYAPIYAWMLLVSAWARRAAFLWAVAPLAAVLIMERMALHKTKAMFIVDQQLSGGITEPFTISGRGKAWIAAIVRSRPAASLHPAGTVAGVGGRRPAAVRRRAPSPRPRAALSDIQRIQLDVLSRHQP